MHVRLDGVERIVLIASELLDVSMVPVTSHLNATVMLDGLDLSVKDVSSLIDLFMNRLVHTINILYKGYRLVHLLNFFNGM